MNTQIRPATPADIPDIEHLLRSLPGVWRPEWRPDVVERAVAAADGLALVAQAGAQIVGFVCAHDCGFRGYLSELVIAEEWQRKGLGKRLVDAVTLELSRRGCAVLVADVFPPALPFYERCGWYPPDAVLVARR